MDAPERDIAQAKDFIAPPGYRRHRPEATLLYQLVAEHYPGFRDRRAAEGRALPRYVEDEFDAYLKCGLLEHGFVRVKCDACQAEKLVAFSCKRRGFCPSCGARRMAETAALPVDDVLPRQPVRQWVLSLPFALRYLLATRPEVVAAAAGRRELGRLKVLVDAETRGTSGLYLPSSARFQPVSARSDGSAPDIRPLIRTIRRTEWRYSTAARRSTST